MIKKGWKKGDFLSEKTPIVGEEVMNPNKVRYTKPIVMLIDYMSGSGGDAFPGLLQGYGRAKLFGTRTMGLGGHVTEIPNLNYSQIKLRMTRSLFYTPKDVEIENNGVTPDVQYKITRYDFLYDYKEYQKAYLKELFKLIE